METSQPSTLSGSSSSRSFGSSSATTSGELVPVTEVTLASNDTIFFEHHIFLWKEPSVSISAKVMKGVGRRMLAGLPVFVTEAHGPGKIAFSRDAPGQILFLDLKLANTIHVREHQFLFCTSNVNYSYYRVKGVSNLLYGGAGMFIDTFEGSGLLALHGYGNVLTRNLASGEMIDVEPGGFLYKEASVQMATNNMGLKSGLFGGFSLFMNRFTGPGRLCIQSMPFHLASGE
jgi:uncharacterized protein (AIM24 family)